MKLSIATAALLASSTNAFVTPNSVRSSSSAIVTKTSNGRNGAVLLKMSSAEEVEKLRAAAAKAREEATQLAKELGKDIDYTKKEIVEETVAKKSMSVEELSSLTSSINFEGGDAMSQCQTLDKMVSDGDLALWNSASANQGLRTYPVSLNFLESRTAGKVTGDSLGISGEDDVSLDDFKYATLGVTAGSLALGVGSLAFLPENIGPTLCYLFALIPIVFLGIGSSAPGIIAGAIKTAKGTADTDDQKVDRICRHEAGHFMAGYLCGLPVKNYAMSEDNGIPFVEFHPCADGMVTRELSKDEIAALSVVALSGSVAEVLGLGDAKGGQNDLVELDGLLRRSAEFIGAQRQQELTRWGALTAYNLLNANKDKFEELVTAFKNKKSVADCVAIIESR